MKQTIDIKRSHFQNTIYELSSYFDNVKTVENLKSLSFGKSMNLTTYFDDLNILDNTDFLELKNHVNQYCDIFSTKVLNKQKYIIKSSWFQAYEKDHWHGVHTHGILPENYSLIFYLQIGENSSPTIFYNTGHPFVEGPNITVFPETSKFVIFQSCIPHEVPPNKDNQRIIFSANFDVY
jgi:hypothetical protein